MRVKQPLTRSVMDYAATVESFSIYEALSGIRTIAPLANRNTLRTTVIRLVDSGKLFCDVSKFSRNGRFSTKPFVAADPIAEPEPEPEVPRNAVEERYAAFRATIVSTPPERPNIFTQRGNL